MGKTKASTLNVLYIVLFSAAQHSKNLVLNAHKTHEHLPAATPETTKEGQTKQR